MNDFSKNISEANKVIKKFEEKITKQRENELRKLQKRKKYDLIFLNVAKEISNLSQDPSTKVGAVISGKENQLISQGFNGFPRGVDDNEERYTNRDLKYKMIVHAEANAIYNALHNGSKLEGCTIYINGLPCCSECSKAVIQTGIKRVVMRINETNMEKLERWMESFELSKKMFDEANIEYEFFKNE